MKKFRIWWYNLTHSTTRMCPSGHIQENNGAHYGWFTSFYFPRKCWGCCKHGNEFKYIKWLNKDGTPMSHFKCRKCGYVDSGYIHIFDPKEWMKDNENLKERFEKMGLHVLIQESPDQNEVSFDCHRLFSCHREKELTMAV